MGLYISKYSDGWVPAVRGGFLLILARTRSSLTTLHSAPTGPYCHILICISELGEGWAPAVIDTQVEHDFIRQSQKCLTSKMDYFVAGSAYPERTGPFEYPASCGYRISYPVPAYSPSESGKVDNEFKGF